MTSDARVTTPPLGSTPRTVPRAPAWIWPLSAVILTVAVASARLLVTPEFYFADDSQTGTAGQWWRLGEQLVAGQFPILDVHAWTAGNILAEGQWGVFNPAIWVIAIVLHVTAQPVLVVTAVKIGALAVMAGGAYSLARSFGASAPWAATAGVLVPLGGFTVYMDAASWTTGLLVSALFPWAWAGLRRFVDERRSPLQFLVATGLLVTLGYVFGVMVLVLVFAEMLVRAVVQRDRPRTARILLAGAYPALLSITVFLPAMLTASVTVRDTNRIENTGFLNADLTDVLAASSATVTASVGSWGTGATAAPLMYALWALPALALVWPQRAQWASLAPLLWVGGFVLLIVLGPDQLGPIRWPVRFMPYVVLVTCVVFAVLATQRSRTGKSAHRAAWAAGVILAVTVWGTYVNTPWEWRQVLVSAIVQGVGATMLWFLLHGRARNHPRADASAAVVVAVVGAVLVIPQMHFFPSTPLPNFAHASDVGAMQSVPGEVPNDAIVVGDIYAGGGDPTTFDERLLANEWYFSDTNVSSLYTVLAYRAYVSDLCADLRGSTCPDALQTLTGVDETTGKDVAALLGVNTIIVMKASFGGELPPLAEDWELRENGDSTWVLVRADPVPAAGGVSWMGEGTDVVETSRSQTDVTLEVRAVGEDSRVVLGRLAWPGTALEGARSAESLRGYLLTVDVAGLDAGDIVTVSFRPPGWWLELASLVGAVILAVGLLVGSRRRASARRRTGSGSPLVVTD